MLRLVLLVLLGSKVLCFAQRDNLVPDFDDGTLSFYHDNDVFTGTDRDYTAGWRIAWISGIRELADVSPIQRRLNFLSGGEGSSSFFKDFWGFENSKDLKYQYGMSVMQQMFTPTTFTVPVPPNERPYAGWLGLGFSLHVSDEKAINSVAFTFGTVGPHSLAEEFQDTVHDIIDSDIFAGWDTQIPNEFTFNINLNQKRRFNYIEPDDFSLFPFTVNGFTETGLALGNFKTAASFGWQAQIGHNVPIDFSNPRLSPTANSTSWHSRETSSRFSAYLILGVSGSAVLHDITLDGPVYRDFDTNEKSKPFVGEYYYGFGLRYKDVELSYINTVRTKEYASQQNHQEFASIAVRIHY